MTARELNGRTMATMMAAVFTDFMNIFRSFVTPEAI
jgi:hypothetical protein